MKFGITSSWTGPWPLPWQRSAGLKMRLKRTHGRKSCLKKTVTILTFHLSVLMVSSAVENSCQQHGFPVFLSNINWDSSSWTAGVIADEDNSIMFLGGLLGDDILAARFDIRTMRYDWVFTLQTEDTPLQQIWNLA
jgi:hypothetical protein